MSDSTFPLHLSTTLIKKRKNRIPEGEGIRQCGERVGEKNESLVWIFRWKAMDGERRKMEKRITSMYASAYNVAKCWCYSTHQKNEFRNDSDFFLLIGHQGDPAFFWRYVHIGMKHEGNLFVSHRGFSIIVHNTIFPFFRRPTLRITMTGA